MTPRCDTRFAHIPALLFLCSITFCLWCLVHFLPLVPLLSCSPCAGHRLLSTTCMHNIAWHHIPPIPHSQELFCLCLCLPHQHSPSPKSSQSFLHFREILAQVGFCSVLSARSWARCDETYDWRQRRIWHSRVGGQSFTNLWLSSCSTLPPAPSDSHPPHIISANSMKLYSPNIPLRVTYGLTPTRSAECESPTLTLYQ